MYLQVIDTSAVLEGNLHNLFVVVVLPNGCHVPDNIFKSIFMNKMFCILIRIPLKCLLKGPINNSLALFQIMAWRQPGNKPLSEQMLTQFTEAYMWH